MSTESFVGRGWKRNLGAFAVYWKETSQIQINKMPWPRISPENISQIPIQLIDDGDIDMVLQFFVSSNWI